MWKTGWLVGPTQITMTVKGCSQLALSLADCLPLVKRVPNRDFVKPRADGIGPRCRQFDAGALFVLPSLFISIALSSVDVAFGDLPLVAGIFYGLETRRDSAGAVCRPSDWRAR